MSLEGTAELGTRLDALKELRKLLARAIDECESKRDLAALSNRFTDVVAQIADLESGVKSEVVDPVGLALAKVVDIR